MTKSTVQSQPDIPLMGVAGWFLFMWGVSHVFPSVLKAPWSFDGWVGSVLSVASWGVGGLATIAIAMMFVNQERKPLFRMPLELLGVMAGWGLVFVVLIASLHFISAESIGVNAPTMAGHPLKRRIEKLRDQQERLRILTSELAAERSAVVGRIREGNSQAIHAHELLEIDRSLKQLKAEADDVAATVTKGEALLRQTERQRRLHDAGLDSNELAELRIEIEEKLSEPQSAGEAIRLDRMIREAVREK